MSHLDGYLKAGEVFYISIFTNEGIYFSENTLDTITDIIYDMNERDYFLLFGFTILPNEIHLIIRVKSANLLDKIVNGIKRRISQRLGSHSVLGTTPWKKGYTLESINSRTQLIEILNFIHKLTKEKGLVDKPGEYRYSSSYGGNPTDLDVIW